LADKHFQTGHHVTAAGSSFLDQQGVLGSVHRIDHGQLGSQKAGVNGHFIDVRVHADGRAVDDEIGDDVVASFPGDEAAADVFGQVLGTFGGAIGESDATAFGLQNASDGSGDATGA